MQQPGPRLSREEIAKREIGQTDIKPALARVMVAVFLATILAVPIVQSIENVRGRSGGPAGPRPNSPSTAPAPSRVRPSGWASFSSLLDGVVGSYRGAKGGRASKILAANARLLKNIHESERRLEDDSFLTRGLLGPTQYWLTRLGGVGNEKAYVGPGGWLFYRPGVDYVTGPAFLDPAVLARRASEGNEYTAAPQPDPRPAVLGFQKRLAGAGARLVLVPTPAKAMIGPEHLSMRYRERSGVLQNVSFDRFRAEMEAAGVLVFDPAPVLLEYERKAGRPAFLKTDTHWSPDAMRAVAERLGAFINERVALPPAPGPAAHYQTRSAAVRNLGDIAAMLRLPRGQDLFPEEEVAVRQVVGPDGAPWRPSAEADVLLLGDSYTNIYSMAAMNWGESAGLAEQLAFVLGRPIDRIAQNDAGAHATRQALALEMARGHDRLAGKRVVVWQFAARELAVGDWKRVAFPSAARTREATPAAPAASAASTAGRWVVRARIQAIADVPTPGSVPYREAIIAVHLTEAKALKGPAARPEIVVYLWGMRDNRLTAAAQLQPGQEVSLALTPWEQAQERYGRFTRVELDDPDFLLIDLPTYWADLVP